MGEGQLGQLEGADEVDVEDVPEDLLGCTVEIGVGDDLRRARVVHEHVEAVVGRDGGVDEAASIGRVGHVALDVARGRAAGAQLGGHRLAGLDRRRRVDHHRRALGREATGGGLPDAARGPGDEDDLACEARHGAHSRAIGRHPPGPPAS